MSLWKNLTDTVFEIQLSRKVSECDHLSYIRVALHSATSRKSVHDMLEHMSPYLVLILILEFFLARLAYGLGSDVTALLANLLNKPFELYYFIFLIFIQ